MTTRDEYASRMKAQIDDLNAQIDALQTKAREARSDAREQYEAEMVKLREQSKKAGDKLKELKNAGEDTWEKLVTEMDKLRDAFVHSFNYFKSQLK